MAPQGAAQGLYVEKNQNDRKPTNEEVLFFATGASRFTRSCCVYTLSIYPITVSFLL